MSKEKYPQIRVKEKQPYYGELLLNDYAGSVSELTAWSQYLNHGGVIFEQYPEVGEILYYIGNEEMAHLQILNKLIKLLGVNPKYRIIKEDDLRIWWSPSYINYKNEVSEILKANIDSEKNTITQYTDHLNIIEDDYVKAILISFVMEERKHLKILEKTYEDFIGNKPIRSITDYTNKKDNINQKFRQNITPPNREFTLQELRNLYNGEEGRPAYVAVHNIVFDVTNVGPWAGGSHFGLIAGMDLSNVFNRHHDGRIEVLLANAPVVGYIENMPNINIMTNE